MIQVAAAIIVLKNKILITRRSEKMKLPNLWEFPGGKVKKDEILEDCIVREIKEELGVNIKVNHHFMTVCHKYDFGEIQLVSYVAEIERGNIELREHADYKWVEPSELQNYEFAPADIPIATKLKEVDVCHLIQD